MRMKKIVEDYVANIPAASPARFNHPYQYLHALFTWCAKQDCCFPFRFLLIYFLYQRENASFFRQPGICLLLLASFQNSSFLICSIHSSIFVFSVTSSDPPEESN